MPKISKNQCVKPKLSWFLAVQRNRMVAPSSDFGPFWGPVLKFCPEKLNLSRLTQEKKALNRHVFHYYVSITSQKNNRHIFRAWTWVFDAEMWC